MRTPTLIVALAAATAAAAGPETAVIRSGVPWYDTDGSRMYAGGANMYVEAGTYWLIGEGKKVFSVSRARCAAPRRNFAVSSASSPRECNCPLRRASLRDNASA